MGTEIMPCTEDVRKFKIFCLEKRGGGQLEVSGGHKCIGCIKNLQEEIGLIVSEDRIELVEVRGRPILSL